MKFDRDLFFENYRKQFGQITHQYQVDGLRRLLSGFETYYGWWDDLRQIANSFAQIGHETGHSFTPVCEAYYLGDPNKPNYFSGNTSTVEKVQRSFYYYPHFGRGDIQLTHAGNYADQDARIRKYFPERVADFEKRTGTKFDLIKHPEQALDGWISFCAMTIGMQLGTFRAGHNLDRYITPTLTDYDRARNIVNGDRLYIKNGSTIGSQIKRSSQKFEAILKASLVEDQILTIDEITPLVDTIEPVSTAEDTAVSQTSSPTGPAIPVEPAGAVLGLNNPPEPSKEQPDPVPPADQPPATMTIEDAKPWVIRWLKRIWGMVTGLNFSQFSGFSIAALNDPPNWIFYAAGILIAFLLIGVCAGVPTIVLLIIWYVNRREINSAKELKAKLDANPDSKDLKLFIDRK